ncbi:MAG: carbohydrate kinase [Sciscionella sp.]|nr:carbohydrate kinase [Sciscionella sp.]
MIIVGGEALVDLVPVAAAAAGELSPLLPRLGGGPFNVAIAAGRLGAPTAFVSRISTDHFGDAQLDRLRLSNVDTSLVRRGPEPTALAVVGIAADGSARYSFHTDGTADRLFRAPSRLPDGTRIVSLGTLSLVLEPGASEYESLLRKASAAGMLTVLDPNIRPQLITDPDSYRARFASWLPDIAVLKVSVEDARWLADDATGELSSIMRGWRSAGASTVVWTAGDAGLGVLTGDGERVEVPAASAKVVDTIGAGDTVHGALLAWLHRAGVHTSAQVSALSADRWADALRYAAAAAAVTVSRVGAEPPFAAELGKC